MRSLVIDSLSQGALDQIRKISVVDYCPVISEKEILNIIQDYDILIMRSRLTMNSAWLANAVHLKTVIRAGNGTDNIPLQLLIENKIRFFNIPDASSLSVAEYAVGLIIAAMRNFFAAERSTSEGKWLKPSLIGNEIAKKTIGMIGYGRVGRELTRLLRPFDTNIIYANLSGNSFIDQPARWVTLEDLAKESDVITIQAPLTELTYHLLDETFFRKLQRQPYVINLARMDMINVLDLKKALEESRLRGVIIDPFEEKHLHLVDYFRGLPVYFMPHLGANTYEAQGKIGKRIVELIE